MKKVLHISVGIVGSGQIAKGLIKLFLKKRIRPKIYVRRKERIPRLKKEFLDYQKRKFPKQIPLDITYVLRYSDLSHCDVIIEAISEDFQEKVNVYQKLKKHINKKTIVGTTTSSFSIGELAKKGHLEEQLIGLHFFNPPQAISFLEVIPADKFQKQLLAKLLLFLDQLGYEYEVVKDIPGFVANTILFSALLSAVDLVIRGGISEVTVDTIIKKSLKHPMGPFELLDFIGVDTADVIFRNLFSSEEKKLSSWVTYYRRKKKTSYVK
ncbi:hypothetical protein A2960_04070 [Candidatus Gottesmanbacteria bacterium RIFCSPLOWO2_01_FULL_39_12b]|uniref:3-hydroxyacyl-CoA dehydrogenase NAD binding domain-containing protein n=1 Tax=Candidatus Gottesmanbacteria bacterium RIFCSPLOWO2_01_FULL_39_12b TaxID=1798388 RepID=A0A1F6ANQ5_9BACT|nr:MAG: hypothetical protein A2960_04070 [Candidatus Gottesmanbacteria bacterium RIFCSPLOWO2_01_FULL_39_12b]